MSPLRPPDDGFSDIPDPLGQGALEGTPLWLPPNRPTRAEVRTRGRAALALSVAWVLAELAWFGVRGDLASVPAGYLVALIAAPIAAAALCLGLALARGRLGMGARVGLIVAATLGPVLALLVAIVLFSPAVPDGNPGAPVEIAYCFNVTLGFALLPMLAAGVALRRSFAALSRWRSALVGLAAGLVGAAMVNLHCDRVGVAHLVLGHVAAAVAVAVLGALVLSHATRA